MGRITLRGVRALGRHGADPGERDREQPFDIDATIELDSAKAERSDDLADTLDYAALHRRLVTVVASTSYSLLERLASALLDAVFEDDRVRYAELTVAKPGILAGATPSVTLDRRRE
jgi:FolB domain-containing protein